MDRRGAVRDTLNRLIRAEVGGTGDSPVPVGDGAPPEPLPAPDPRTGSRWRRVFRRHRVLDAIFQLAANRECR